MAITERYTALPVGVNSTVTFTGTSVGGFLAITSGTVTVKNFAGTSIIASFPVTAGVYHPMPFYIDKNGGTITTAGGASGVAGVQ